LLRDLDFENEEITLTEARKIEPDFEIGEDVSEEVKLIDLGRRAILALRQNLISKIHEHDNTNLYKQFKDLIGEIYTAEVHHVRPRVVILVDDEGNNCFTGRNKYLLIFSVREMRGIIESVELK
jgi:N utilization substance protein A